MNGATLRSEQLPNTGVGSERLLNGAKNPLYSNGSVNHDHTVHPATNGFVKAQHPEGLAGLSNGQSHIAQAQDGHHDGNQSISQDDGLEILCGPLLNFRHLDNIQPGMVSWHGSVLVVTKSGTRRPELRLRSLLHASKTVDRDWQRSPQNTSGIKGRAPDEARHLQAVKLYEDFHKTFWCFELDVPLQVTEARWEYTVLHAYSIPGNPSISPKIFAVPSMSQSMRIMFHSCNGFSVGTDEEAWSGPALWNDVLREHEQKPFHVMIGGGDQIYNDGVRVDGPLREWADLGNPKRRRDHPFGEELQAECDLFYFRNYAKWYTSEPFATANGQIPQINIWDDHGRPSLGSIQRSNINIM